MHSTKKRRTEKGQCEETARAGRKIKVKKAKMHHTSQTEWLHLGATYRQVVTDNAVGMLANLHPKLGITVRGQGNHYRS